MDDALADYARAEWLALVRFAGMTLGSPDAVGRAEAIVADALVRVGSRRRTTAPSELDAVVRARIVRSVVAADARRADDLRGGVMAMEIVDARDVRAPVAALSRVELTVRALADLPAAMRVAIVERYANGPDDSGTAGEISPEALEGLRWLEDNLRVEAAGTVTGDGTSRVEELVRSTYRDWPVPAMPRGDAVVEEVDRGIAAHRRRRLVTGVAVVAVLAVVAGVGLTRGGGTATKPKQTSANRHALAHRPPIVAPAPTYVPTHAYARVASTYPVGIAVGGGYLWTLDLRPSARNATSLVERRNLSTGQIEKRYAMPATDYGIGYGLGRVWAWSGVPVDDEKGIVTTLNPKTGALRSLASTRGVAVSGVAFTRAAAWLAEPVSGQVVALNARGENVGPPIAVPNALHVVTVGAQSVAVSDTNGAVRELPTDVVAQSGTAPLALLASTKSGGVWINRPGRLSYQATLSEPPVQAGTSLTPAALAAGVTLRVRFVVEGVVGDPQSGVYIAYRSTDPQRISPYLAYYSPAALQTALPSPTAELGGDTEVAGMTAAPDGGIDFVTVGGAVESWNPAAPRAVPSALSGTASDSTALAPGPG